MDNKEYFDKYIEKLTDVLVGQCTSKGFLAGQLLEIEELNLIWKECAPDYMADAVPEINDYPAVAVAWAGYFGMCVASMWDGDWEKYKDSDNLYKSVLSKRGFDCMDEYIAEEVLGFNLESDEYKSIENLMRSCADTTVSMIRKENIEAQSVNAFYVFAHSAKVFFKLGVSLELKRCGYRYEKVNVTFPEKID